MRSYENTYILITLYLSQCKKLTMGEGVVLTTEIKSYWMTVESFKGRTLKGSSQF